jgi:transcription elongation GreA/GreB family factor
MTPEGHMQFVPKLPALRNIERLKIVGIVLWVAGNGDRSENNAYIYGKNACTRSTVR